MKPQADKKPRRKLTVTDHLEVFDARIKRLQSEIEKVRQERTDYINGIAARAAALTAALPKE